MKPLEKLHKKIDTEIEQEMRKLYSWMYGEGTYDIFSQRKFAEEGKREKSIRIKYYGGKDN